MRFWRKNGHRVLVVGIFQSLGAGRAVLQNLHRARFRRAAAIHASAKGRQRVEEHGISVIAGSTAASVLGLALGAFIFWQRGMLADYRPVGLVLPFAAFALAGAITGWILIQLLREHVDSESFARFTNTILPNETVVLAEVGASESSRVLAILRGVEAEAPVTFGFYPPPPFSIESTARPLSHELSSSQRLVEKAASLAHAIAVSRTAKPRGPSFLHRLLEIENALEWTNMSLTMSAEAHHAFTLSAEWLLDNAYLIREQVADLRKSLPQKYYGKLPLIASGPGAGLPRVYQVAAEMVAETDGALEPDIIRRFLAAFQAITPLDIGELWALPLMLRLQLLECLRTLRSRYRSTNSKEKARRPISGQIGSSPPPVTAHRDCSK
ncbi:MAG: hypothetical protein DME80_12645 [Verrucomicrobia bacterium]|nr:MAG: hypothetical protein DME80_12645 [Verrucomicrobiota bacterium]